MTEILENLVEVKTENIKQKPFTDLKELLIELKESSEDALFKECCQNCLDTLEVYVVCHFTTHSQEVIHATEELIKDIPSDVKQALENDIKMMVG